MRGNILEESNRILLRLSKQIETMNENLAEKEKVISFNTIQWTYLFGSDKKTRKNRADYQKYIIFRKAIKDVLSEFGIHMHNNGYSYIIDAVKIIIDLHSMDIRLNNDVYPFIAYMYNLNHYSIVEHSIRNAIISACRDYKKDPNANMMGIFDKQPTNKQFLFHVTEAVFVRMMEANLPGSG